MDANMALWYSIISTVGCATVYFVIDRKGKNYENKWNQKNCNFYAGTGAGVHNGMCWHNRS